MSNIRLYLSSVYENGKNWKDVVLMVVARPRDKSIYKVYSSCTCEKLSKFLLVITIIINFYIFFRLFISFLLIINWQNSLD